MLEIENTMIQMKNAFNGFIRIMPWAEETISELEDTAVETYQSEKKKD